MYKPNQRKIRVEVLAVAGWVSGTFHVAARTTLLAALNRTSEFLPLTDVISDPDAPSISFLAIRRTAMVLVVPGPDELERPAVAQPGSYERLTLQCHLADGTVTGSVHVLSGLRASDFLEACPQFVVLSDCTLDGDGPPRTWAQALLNSSHVLAVMEVRKPAADPGDETSRELVGAASGRGRG